MVVGLTDPMSDRKKLESYVQWIRRGIPGVELQLLSSTLQNAGTLRHCQGLIMTGGDDVHPGFYHREDALEWARNVDVDRDRFEFDVIGEALNRRMPLLGICRGSQIFNVAQGGSLVPDIEHAGHPSHKRGDVPERLHKVLVEAGTLLHEIVRTESGETNTSHHQAVAEPGKGLRVAARSEDGIVEALEWASPDQHPFLLLVQWHPERMTNPDNPFSVNILRRFASELHHARTGA